MRWRLKLLVALMVLAMPGSAALAAALPRLVSMNVCADQLLLTLADPEQILGLSRFSRDGWQSQAGDISRYPVLSGGAEDVLLIRPDIVVVSAARATTMPNRRCIRYPPTAQSLPRAGIPRDRPIS